MRNNTGAKTHSVHVLAFYDPTSMADSDFPRRLGLLHLLHHHVPLLTRGDGHVRETSTRVALANVRGLLLSNVTHGRRLVNEWSGCDSPLLAASDWTPLNAGSWRFCLASWQQASPASWTGFESPACREELFRLSRCFSAFSMASP
jgi:hypothetical protein